MTYCCFSFLQLHLNHHSKLPRFKLHIQELDSNSVGVQASSRYGFDYNLNAEDKAFVTYMLEHPRFVRLVSSRRIAAAPKLNRRFTTETQSRSLTTTSIQNHHSTGVQSGT